MSSENPRICRTKFKDYTISTARNVFRKNLFETIVLKGVEVIAMSTFGNELDAIAYHSQQLRDLYSIEV